MAETRNGAYLILEEHMAFIHHMITRQMEIIHINEMYNGDSIARLKQQYVNEEDRQRFLQQHVKSIYSNFSEDYIRVLMKYFSDKNKILEYINGQLHIKITYAILESSKRAKPKKSEVINNT